MNDGSGGSAHYSELPLGVGLGQSSRAGGVVRDRSWERPGSSDRCGRYSGLPTSGCVDGRFRSQLSLDCQI